MLKLGNGYLPSIHLKFESFQQIFNYLNIFVMGQFSPGKQSLGRKFWGICVCEGVKKGAPGREKRIHLIKDKYWPRTTNEKPFLFHLKYSACIFHILNKGLHSRCFIFAVFLEVIFPFTTLATRYSPRKTFLPFHRIDASKRGLSAYTSCC